MVKGKSKDCDKLITPTVRVITSGIGNCQGVMSP